MHAQACVQRLAHAALAAQWPGRRVGQHRVLRCTACRPTCWNCVQGGAVRGAPAGAVQPRLLCLLRPALLGGRLPALPLLRPRHAAAGGGAGASGRLHEAGAGQEGSHAGLPWQPRSSSRRLRCRRHVVAAEHIGVKASAERRTHSPLHCRPPDQEQAADPAAVKPALRPTCASHPLAWSTAPRASATLPLLPLLPSGRRTLDAGSQWRLALGISSEVGLPAADCMTAPAPAPGEQRG